jgi:hypothetical protein
MDHQWMELGLMLVLALTCGGIGLVAGRYLNSTGGCCGGGGGHGHHDAPPPDPIRREWDETPRLVLGPFVPPADLASVDHTKVAPALNREEPPGGDTPAL